MKNFLLFSTLLLVACQPVVNSRGNALISEHLNSFTIGKTTMDEVLKKCGTPSLQQNEFTWIYSGATSELLPFRGIEMKNKVLVKLIFDNNKVLKDIKRQIPYKEDISLNDNIEIELISDSSASNIARKKYRSDFISTGIE